MLRIIRRHNSWPKAASIGFLTLILGYFLGGYEDEFSHSIGKPTLPDLAVRIENLLDYARAYSPGAIDLYLSRIAPLDVVFPAALGLTLALTLSRLGAPDRAVRLPLVAAVIDWVENGLIVWVLLTVDAPVEGAGLTASLVTKLKFAAYFAALFAVAIIAFRQVMSQRR